MPAITSEDYRNVALATLLPGSMALLGTAAIVRDPKFFDFWEVIVRWLHFQPNFYHAGYAEAFVGTEEHNFLLGDGHTDAESARMRFLLGVQTRRW